MLFRSEQGKITLNEFEDEFEKFHNKFRLDKRVPNKKNRMISWGSGSIRGQKMVSEKQGSKLTHNFYIHVTVNK